MITASASPRQPADYLLNSRDLLRLQDLYSNEMIDFTLNTEQSLLHVCPTGPLHEADFRDLAASVDPYIKAKGELKGLLIEIGEFPGWADISGMISHFRFARDHHKKIKRIAVVSDSSAVEFGEQVASHFVDAELHHFEADKLAEAKAWLVGNRAA